MIRVKLNEHLELALRNRALDAGELVSRFVADLEHRVTEPAIHPVNHTVLEVMDSLENDCFAFTHHTVGFLANEIVASGVRLNLVPFAPEWAVLVERRVCGELGQRALLESFRAVWGRQE